MMDRAAAVAGRRRCMAIGAIASVLVLTSCGREQSEGTSTRSVIPAPVAVAYPPEHFTWDVVPDIPEPAVDAARFSAETQALSTEAYVSEAAALRVRSLVVPYLDHWRDEINKRKYGPTFTGGGLSRAVAASASGGGGAFVVTVCAYPTPGEYEVEPSGQLKLRSRSGPPWSIVEMLVQKTTEPAADGSTSSAPRWLQVRNPEAMDLSAQAQAGRQALCDRYAPDPLVQTPPAPLPSK